ncbi:unnamed protein product [Tenebrio molitor]|nr:unnamed protein product [Tenebrio molitor]
MRHLRDVSDPFNLPEQKFRDLYRLSREAARHIFLEIVDYMQAPQRRNGTSSVIKYFIALHFFAHGSSQKSVGKDRHVSMSQPNVSRSLHATVDAMLDVLCQRYIKFPTTLQEITTVKQGFFEVFHLPGVLGCIDCTHIEIFPPPYAHPTHPAQVFINRKHRHSINCQIICDSELNITAINARYPGSTHDAAIWMMSNVKVQLMRRYRNGDNNSFLLGDSGYPLEPFLMTPIVGAPPNTPEYRYTQTHGRIRNCIERVNGTLKASFRCLRKEMHYDPSFAAKIIYACAILHNVKRMWNVIDNEEVENDDGIH